MKQKRDREDPCYVCGHYHDYEAGEPCSICGHVMQQGEWRSSSQEAVLPTAVLPGFLYTGSYDTASRAELLKAMGITHILNTVPQLPALFKNTFTYHNLAAAPPDFKECFDVIASLEADSQRMQQQQQQQPQQVGSAPSSSGSAFDSKPPAPPKLLVYCMRGGSRSPSIAIGYLMHSRRMSLADAYRHMKEKRPGTNINPEDTKRLQELEVQLHGRSTAPNGWAALDASTSGGAAGAGGAFGGSHAARGASCFGQPGVSHAPSPPPAAPGAVCNPFTGFGAGSPWSSAPQPPSGGVPSFGVTPAAMGAPITPGGQGQQQQQQQQQQPGLPFVFGSSPAPGTAAEHQRQQQRGAHQMNDMEM